MSKESSLTSLSSFVSETEQEQTHIIIELIEIGL